MDVQIKTKHIVWLHIIFWVFYSVLPFLTFVFHEKRFSHPAFVYSIITTVLNVINFYICYLASNPDIFKKSRLFRNLTLFIGFNVVFTALRLILTYGIYSYFKIVPPDQLQIDFSVIVQEFLNTFGYSWVPITIRFTIDWYREQHQKTELLNQKQASELALLRSQINPHFLFNTLNNIYSLTLKKSDEAPEAVMKLSEIMRYMLHESNHEKVLLKDEIEYLNGFIKLQQLRFYEKNLAEFNIVGNINGTMISPMLFIPFIENAFKHGNKKSALPSILINLKLEENKLDFSISNYLNKDELISKDKNNGIGLQNVRRRLELIYPNSHNLEIQENEDKFIVNLTISKL